MAKFLYSMVHHKPDNKAALWVIINSFVLFCAAGILIYNFFIFGPRDRIVKTYIKGLHDNSFYAIKDVTAREFDSDRAIESDLNNYGGTFFAFHTNYRASRINGLEVITNIYGFKKGKVYKTELTLIGQGEAWYLTKGDLKEEYKTTKE